MPMTDTFTAACIQLRTGRDVDRNIKDTCALIREAQGRGAHFVLTPENTHIMELRRKHLFEQISEEEDDRGLQAFRALADELDLWLSIGGTPVLAGPDKVANRTVLFAPDGRIAARYDKLHLFDVDLPSGESYRESKTYVSGTQTALAELPWGPVGLTICYDLRFPYLYRALAHAGAYYLTVPSAFTQQTGEAHWHVLLRARAIETGCFVFAPAQSGHHDNGRETYGHSLIVDPWGTVLAEAGTEPGVITADIDPKAVEQVRTRLPSLTHDRPLGELARF